MIVQTSRSAALRIVGRLERGERVHETLVALATANAVTAAQVTATGLLEDAEIAAFDLERRAF